MTRGARRTFRDAVELEVEQARLLREQGEIVMEGRLVALGKLVAGLSHEINTPVAVLKSNATTIGTALKLIRGALPKTDPKMERVLDDLDKGSKGSIEASERVDATLQTLRSFARLDNAELGHSDLSADLDGVLELIPRETIGRTRVERDYGELPRIECFPRRLNQVFITLLTNAFDAIEGRRRRPGDDEEREWRGRDRDPGLGPRAFSRSARTHLRRPRRRNQRIPSWGRIRPCRLLSNRP